MTSPMLYGQNLLLQLQKQWLDGSMLYYLAVWQNMGSVHSPKITQTCSLIPGKLIGTHPGEWLPNGYLNAKAILSQALFKPSLCLLFKETAKTSTCQSIATCTCTCIVHCATACMCRHIDDLPAFN